MFKKKGFPKKKKFKISIIGSSYVGKTSIYERYFHDIFDEKQPVTVGVDPKSEEIVNSDGIFTMMIWDTSGNKRYNNVNRLFLKGSDVIVCVFSYNDMESVLSLPALLEDVDSLNIKYKYLVGNKCDLDKGLITSDSINQLEEKYDIIFFKTSAKSKDGIDDLFEHIIDTLGQEIIEYNKALLREDLEPLIMQDDRVDKKNSCCWWCC